MDNQFCTVKKELMSQDNSTKESYIAPTMEILEVKIEKGYAGSLTDRDNNEW